mmetsp:Transcript_29132/g.58733  ORF Transcript_29132/g.58733 Transcript_29132/m.58733 type:complete len:975 (+) Transcript_29132:183-3107(+)
MAKTLTMAPMPSSDDDSDTLGSFSIDSSLGNSHGASKDSADRDMTEDEVAIMVKNALRKARRAMHNSSPSTQSLDSKSLQSNSLEGDGVSVGLGVATTSSTLTEGEGKIDAPANNIAKKIEPMAESLSYESEGDATVAATNEDDIARRIEEEIHSARAFAEKVYYGGKGGSPKKSGPKDGGNATERTPVSPRNRKNDSNCSPVKNKPSSTPSNASNKSISPVRTDSNISDMTPKVNNKEAVSMSATKRKTSRLSGGGGVPKDASDEVLPRPPAMPISPSKREGGKSSLAAKVPLKLEIEADSDDEEDFGSIHYEKRFSSESKKSNEKAAVTASLDRRQLSSKAKKSSESPRSPEKKSKQSEKRISSPPLSPVSTKNEKIQKQKPAIKEPLSPSSILSSTSGPSTTASSESQTPTNSSSAYNHNGKRENRLVVFRHPYPLPPPPVLPRADEIIIAENSAKEHDFNVKWVDPNNDLLQLIQAAEDDNLVRRSNACGAIKVLVSKDTNQARLCRTNGLLNALITASMDDAVDSDALDARTRAVTALLYLSEPKDNRFIMAKHPQLLDVLVKVIEEDTGEARLRACSTLATLAKTPQNRGIIANIDKLADVLSDLMVINAVPKENEEKIKPEAAKIKEATSEGEEGIERAQTAESRDDTFRDEDTMGSYNSEDDRLLTNTYSGTFSAGSGTFTEDDYTFHDESIYSGTDGGSYNEDDEDIDDAPSAGYSMDDGSVEEEEGVEMQISSLKKLNIENHSDFLAKSQLSACATLTHLTKHCANAPLLSKNEKVLKNVLMLATIFHHPLHTRCIEILCNFSRFPSNNARLAAMPKVVETLLICGKSKIAEDRMWAVRTIQNLCSDATSKVKLATGQLLSLLSAAAMRKDYDEQFAAVGALMNLSTEPGAIVPLTNTKTVVASLVHLAHSPNTPATVRKIACDSLATIGLWLQTLASAGTVPEDIPFSPLPTHTATGWLRWES